MDGIGQKPQFLQHKLWEFDVGGSNYSVEVELMVTGPREMGHIELNYRSLMVVEEII
jgi:hypothetical protein